MEHHGMKQAEAQIDMKRTLILLFALISLTGMAQIDTVIYYDSLQVYRIDTTIITTTDTITSDSNYVWQFYHYIETREGAGATFNYQPQFVIYDSLNNRLLPNQDLIGAGWRSSGTVKEFTIDSAKAAQTPDSLRTFYILPDLKSIYGNDNVTKL